MMSQGIYQFRVCVCVCVYIYIYIYIQHEIFVMNVITRVQTGIGFHEANILKGASIQSIEE
jgi:hypothetical protein